MYERKTTDRCLYCDTLVQSWWGSAPCGYVCSKGQRLILYLLNCITQPKSKPMGSRALGLWPMADKKKKKSRQNACTAHARGHLLKFLLCLSFGARLTVCLISVCRLVAPAPSPTRLAVQWWAFVSTDWLFCPMRCRYAAPDRPLALRSLPALLSLTLTRSDWVRTDTQRGKFTATANIWWCDFR